MLPVYNMKTLCFGVMIGGLMRCALRRARNWCFPRPPRLAFIFSLSATLILAAGMANAATLTVVSPGDNGPGTLRQAIADAASGDTVIFAQGLGGVGLTSGELLISKSLVIRGPGANLLFLQRVGPTAFRILEVTSASVPVTVDISGVTISGGATAEDGGGIYNSGNQSSVHVTGCVISNNSAVNGAGLRNLGSGSISITDSTISGNSAQSGAGLYNSGALMVNNCTFSGNMSSGNGGGISSAGGNATLTNCTIASNSATSLGGGIYGNGGTLNLTSGTVSTNSSSQGGGIFNAQGTVNLTNTIVASNTASVGPDAKGTLTSKGYNLIGNIADATFTAMATDLTGASAGLDTLKDNGGPTKTMALLSGSAAIDKGNSSGSTTDQRGLGRPIDGPGVNNASGGDGSDIGAYELHGASVPGCGDNVVTNNGDTGPGSLRAILAGVCANDTITFASNGQPDHANKRRVTSHQTYDD